ncbi:MAG: hypothetical protein FWD98_09020, partial [Defluviitaleaceae bacterium]|nr:hypothetical protein [Defluviitaleaceae bacterium]
MGQISSIFSSDKRRARERFEKRYKEMKARQSGGISHDALARDLATRPQELPHRHTDRYDTIPAKAGRREAARHHEQIHETAR